MAQASTLGIFTVIKIVFVIVQDCIRFVTDVPTPLYTRCTYISNVKLQL